MKTCRTCPNEITDRSTYCPDCRLERKRKGDRTRIRKSRAKPVLTKGKRYCNFKLKDRICGGRLSESNQGDICRCHNSFAPLHDHGKGI